MIYRFISIFSFWLGEEDAQRQDRPLRLINITFELDLCSYEQCSFLQKNLHQMPQFYDFCRKGLVMHSERHDYSFFLYYVSWYDF